MDYRPSKEELEKRIGSLYQLMETRDYDTILIINKINQYYFTGTMQDGLLVFKRDGSYYFFVRRSYERARIESPIEPIIKFSSYREMGAYLPKNLGITYLESQSMSLAIKERLDKHIEMDEVHHIDSILYSLRAIKSPFEIDIIKEAGRQHQKLLIDIVPSLLEEGMSETSFFGKLYLEMIKLGYQGISRFGMFQTEMLVGQMGFGPNSSYPSSFDGPGGMKGMYPAMPIIGDRNSYLKKGDIVFVDIGYGIGGYHTDKTMVYSFKKKADQYIQDIHKACMDIQLKSASLMVPGNKPSYVYEETLKDLSPLLKEGFMGLYDQVKFLGHGVGLQIDEQPIIASGFNEPLKENMVISLEPKCAVKNIGSLGVEETFIIKVEGAQCVTGGCRQIMLVD